MTPEDIRNKYSLRNPAVTSVLQFLADSHLHPDLKRIVITLRDAAFILVDNMQDGPELTVALRRLVDAKDSFVRHYLVTHRFQLTPQPKNTADAVITPSHSEAHRLQ
jgi:hypothetical protein